MKRIGLVFTVTLVLGSVELTTQATAGIAGGSRLSAVQEWKPILFQIGNARISSSDPVIVSVAEWLEKNPEETVVIEGHAWEEGESVDPRSLSEERAEATHSLLRGRGIEANRMKTVSFGDERPACTDEGESCWQRNRRAEIRRGS